MLDVFPQEPRPRLVHDIRVRTDPYQVTRSMKRYAFTVWHLGEEPLDVVNRRNGIQHIVDQESWRFHRFIGVNDVLVYEDDKVVFKSTAFDTLRHCGQRVLADAQCCWIIGGLGCHECHVRAGSSVQANAERKHGQARATQRRQYFGHLVSA